MEASAGPRRVALANLDTAQRPATVAHPSEAGERTLCPGGGVARLATTSSFSAGRTRANDAVVGLSGGVLSVRNRQASGTVHVIPDVSGRIRQDSALAGGAPPRRSAEARADSARTVSGSSR